jgi:hypothetical protein
MFEHLAGLLLYRTINKDTKQSLTKSARKSIDFDARKLFYILFLFFSEDSVEEIVPPDTKIDAEDLYEEDNDDNKEEDEDEREENAADEIRLKKPTPGTE